MASKDFLVELGTEELPPKALHLLSNSFASGVKAGLETAKLNFKTVQPFATPRRLALLVTSLDESQSDSNIERFGPARKAAFDEEGKPTAAAAGFARSCGVAVEELETVDKDGVEKLVFRSTQKGKPCSSLLPDIVANSLTALPIPKRMRWGSSREEFVRPVHWLLMLFGNDIINTTILGIEASNISYGHRFHHNEKIVISEPSSYEQLLESPGMVIADFSKRKQLIQELVIEQGKNASANAVIDDALLEEVTSLVELPVALTGKFDEHFLEVPAEALISAMKSHQKYFYLEDDNAKLLPNFITVSNLMSKDPAQVIEGNERVIRPRLADAKFFFDSDKKQTLESRLEQLKKIVFQKKLGTVHDKALRVAKLANALAGKLNFDQALSERAGLLSKCDLISDMVGEFADLQGLMGYYYAINDGEHEEVAKALHEQYMPRYAGDTLPSTPTGCVVAVADKLDTIVGLFAIGQPPTGSKDPFALRRAAIGILRILVEKELDLNLKSAITLALNGFEFLELESDLSESIFDFMLERFKAWYQDEGITAEVFQSVFALKPQTPLDFHQRIHAVNHFSQLEQAHSLANANKRVSNILAKLDDASSIKEVDPDLLQEEAEIKLANAIASKENEVAPLFDQRQYREGLAKLATIKEDVDTFFDDVLVMAEDPALRDNRVALLYKLRKLFLEVADISLLHSS